MCTYDKSKRINVKKVMLCLQMCRLYKLFLHLEQQNALRMFNHIAVRGFHVFNITNMLIPTLKEPINTSGYSKRN